MIAYKLKPQVILGFGLKMEQFLILISNFGLVGWCGDVRNSYIWVSSNTTTGYLAFSKGFDLFVKEPGKKKKSHSSKTPFSGCLPLDREPVLYSLFSFQPSLPCSYKLPSKCLSDRIESLFLQRISILFISKM